MTSDLPGLQPAPERYADAESLFRAVYRVLVRVAYRLLGNRADTEDAVQNSFLKLMAAWPRIASWPAARQRAYLVRIVTNEALQILRYPHRSWEQPGAEAGQIASARPSVEESVQAKEEFRLVWKAVGELPRACRDVVMLYAAGYEYEEIAAELDITISTVRSHISNARTQLSRTVPRGWKGEQQ